MLSLDMFRRAPQELKALLQERGVSPEEIDVVLQLDESRRKIGTELDSLRAVHKRASKEVKTKEMAQDQLVALRQQSDRIKELEDDLGAVLSRLENLLLELPNVPKTDAARVQTGISREPGESETISEESISKFAPKCDGYRPMLKGVGVLLERVIINSLVEAYAARGYMEVLLPSLVRPDVLIASGELPVMEGYVLKCELDNLYATPSVEVPLAYLHPDEVLPHDVLPMRYVTFGPGFSSSILGRPAHRFDKRPTYPFSEVAAYSFVRCPEAQEEFSLMGSTLESAFQQLELPYRVVMANAKNLGFAAELSHIHQVWFPAARTYVQVALTTSYGAFQARRSKTRFRPAPGQRPEYVCTVGQTTRVGLLIAAILENGQAPDGSVKLPEVLATRVGTAILHRQSN